MVPDDDGDVWGEVAEEDEHEDDLPDLPAMPVSPPDEASPPPKSMVALGPPPVDDAMAMAKWAYQFLMLQAHETMLDPNLSEAQRRKEIRVILAGASKHMNDAMRFDTAQLIRRDREAIESRKRARAAAKPEARPSPGGAKVIPIRRDG